MEVGDGAFGGETEGGSVVGGFGGGRGRLLGGLGCVAEGSSVVVIVAGVVVVIVPYIILSSF